ncbi:DedA family protein [Jatrophihabitans sp. YIM 134969]
MTLAEPLSAPEQLGFAYLLYLFAVVAFGATVPVVPTGAAVSVAAALGEQDNVLLLVLVVVFGAAGAYTGDIATYAILRLAGVRLAERIGWLKGENAQEGLRRIRQQLEEHELRSLLLSRLIPGGRVPVLLAASLGGYSWRRFAIADIAAATLWSVLYAAIGIAGRAVFPEPWQGAVAAIVLVLVLSAVGSLVQRRRSRHGHAAPAAAPAPPS